jgi:hypothetical protein
MYLFLTWKERIIVLAVPPLSGPVVAVLAVSVGSLPGAGFCGAAFESDGSKHFAGGVPPKVETAEIAFAYTASNSGFEARPDAFFTVPLNSSSTMAIA